MFTSAANLKAHISIDFIMKANTMIISLWAQSAGLGRCFLQEGHLRNKKNMRKQTKNFVTGGKGVKATGMEGCI